MLVARASLSDAEHRVSRLNVWCCTFVRVVNRDARFVEHRVGSRQLRVSRKDPNTCPAACAATLVVFSPLEGQGSVRHRASRHRHRAAARRDRETETESDELNSVNEYEYHYQ